MTSRHHRPHRCIPLVGTTNLFHLRNHKSICLNKIIEYTYIFDIIDKILFHVFVCLFACLLVCLFVGIIYFLNALCVSMQNVDLHREVNFGVSLLRQRSKAFGKLRVATPELSEADITASLQVPRRFTILSLNGI